MDKRKEKKHLLWKTALAAMMLLSIGFVSLLAEGNMPLVAAAESSDAAEISGEAEFYDGLEYDIIYQDKAGLVSAEEKDAVLESMEPISAYANVIFYTTDTYEASETATVCEKVCVGYYGRSKKAPVVLFTIDLYHREIYVYCTGPTRHIIRNRDATSITDNIYRLASAERYDQCAISAFEQCLRLLSGSSIRRPMQRINNLFLAIILGFLLNYLYLTLSRKAALSKENEKGKPFDKNRFELELKKNCTRTYTYTESESSGGGGGGYDGGSSSGGGGGGYDGGGSSGGGHSF